MTPETKAKLAENLKKARAAKAKKRTTGKQQTTASADGLARQLVARAKELEAEARRLVVKAKALRRAARLVG